MDDNNERLGPPLYENQTIMAAGITCDCRVVIEQGPAPTNTQVATIYVLIHTAVLLYIHSLSACMVHHWHNYCSILMQYNFLMLAHHY